MKETNESNIKERADLVLLEEDIDLFHKALVSTRIRIRYLKEDIGITDCPKDCIPTNNLPTEVNRFSEMDKVICECIGENRLINEDIAVIENKVGKKLLGEEQKDDEIYTRGNLMR